MTLTDLMQALAERKVKLGLENGELSLVASKGALSQDLLQQVRLRKRDIIESLSLLMQTSGQMDFEVTPDPGRLNESFPFSDLQVGFYMASDPYMDYHVAPHYYNEFDRCDLDVKRYEQAINGVLQRHAAEAVLVAGDGQLLTLAEIPRVTIPVVDLSERAPDDRSSYLESVRRRMMREELPVARWPWFDLLISTWQESGGCKARIHCNFNNFYSDGFGVTVFQREVEALYQNPSLELPPLSLSYRDAVLGLAALSESAEGERAKKYWLERLPLLPEPPAIPMLAGVNRKCRSRLNRREGFLQETHWSAIKRIGKDYGLTPTSIVITAYAEILAIWSGCSHFVLSNMVTRRLPIHPEIKSILGNFASLYPLEVDLRGDLPFVDKCQRLQRQILADADHRQWGGMQVMQAFNQLKGEFGSVPCPFVIGSALFMEGFRKADFSCLETAQTLFDHQFWEQEDGSFYYVWDLLDEFFPPGMVNQMWSTYNRLLEILAGSRSQWQSRCFDIAPRPSLVESAAAGHPVDSAVSELLHEGFVRYAIADPHRTALQLPDRTYSYGEIAVCSRAIQSHMRNLNLPPHSLIAVLMDRDIYLVAASLAILQAGYAYVPIDPAYPPERVEYLLRNSRAGLVITQHSYRSRLADRHGLEVFVAEEISGVGAERQGTAETAMHAIQSQDLAYVIYTSGSTGQPKGVMIEHGGALNTLVDINRRFKIDASDKIFGVSSFSFDLSVYDLFGTFAAGASLVYPHPEQALNPAHWLEIVKSRSVTVWNSAPPLMTLLVESAERQKAILPELRLVLLSGDWIPVDLPERIRRIAPNASLISLGGATEASIWSIYYRIEAVDPKWISIPYGKPLAGQYWQIRDAQGRRVPLWSTGELFITGRGLARGYWEDGEKSARSFISDPLTGERLYRTGDLGRYLPDGNIEFIGRMDNQVKIQGHRIELGEIEAAIGRSPLVRDVVVLANSSGSAAASAKSDRILVAYIVPNIVQNIVPNIAPNIAPSDPTRTAQEVNNQAEAEVLQQSGLIETIRHQLKQILPVYMLPAGWSVLPAMPITANGKIDRAALAQIDHAVARQDGKVSGASRVDPQNALERKLVCIWSKVLNIAQVGVTADFFELGGRSFDAVRCISMIKETTGHGLTLGDMWEYRTIRNLAERLENTAGGAGPLRKINTGVSGAPIIMVHPGGGQIIGYYGLAGNLRIPAYAFFATAEDVHTGRLSSIESIASRYIQHFQSYLQDTPAVVLGWSSGACIAYEIAAQLERAGDPVQQIIVVDAPAPLRHRQLSRLEMFKGFFEDLALDLPVADIEGLGLDFAAGDAAEQFSQIATLFNEHLRKKSDYLRSDLDIKELFGIYEVFNACVTSVRNYRPQPITTGITLIRATAGGVSEFVDYPFAKEHHWGWAGLTRGAVSTRWLAGNHHTLLQNPALGHLTAVVLAAIAAAAKENDKTNYIENPVPV